MIFIIFEFCTIGVCVLLLAMIHIQHRRINKLRDSLAALALEVSRLKEEYEPDGVDSQAVEKAWKEHVDRIMGYSLTQAMGGGLNG